MKKYLFCILLCVPGLFFGQFIKKSPPFSVRGSIGIPRSISSSMFHTCFNGVYEASVSGTFRLFNNVFAGPGVINSHFQNNKGLFRQQILVDPTAGTATVRTYNTRLNCLGAFLNVGYDQFFEKSYMTYSLRAGYMVGQYTNVLDDFSARNLPVAPKRFDAPFVQPEVSANFMTDGRLTFSILFSYGIMMSHFDPKSPRFNAVEEVFQKSNKAPITWINIGFGFSVLIGDLK